VITETCLGVLSVIASSGCYAPGPEVVLVAALPGQEVPMLTADPIRARVLLFNPETGGFDISRHVTIPAGMTVQYVDIEQILDELQKYKR
jgi:hypothetical protein